MTSGPGYKEHPEHKVELQRPEQKVRVQHHGNLLAESYAAVVVNESGHDPVYYIPRPDVDMSRLMPSDKQYDCPFKGHANYFSLETGDGLEDNVAWSYEDAYDEVKDLEGYIAFDSSKVEMLDLGEVSL